MRTTKPEREWRKEFAKHMRARMEFLDINQRQLAKMSGVSESEISRYLRGLKTPLAYTVTRLATGLNMKPAELMDF